MHTTNLKGQDQINLFDVLNKQNDFVSHQQFKTEIEKNSKTSSHLKRKTSLVTFKTSEHKYWWLRPHYCGGD